ncbi:uncharacterized protein LOC141909677 [Tubulanus polymorphus]|uniref:uncharacterized protein LOC141909677 n=1 Tax=Tubulanus polymorphus TaxID=672921 RepID=UPI003DA30596
MSFPKSKRFAAIKSDAPPVGAYNPKNPAGNSLPNIVVPKSERWKSEPNVSSLPPIPKPLATTPANSTMIGNSHRGNISSSSARKRSNSIGFPNTPDLSIIRPANRAKDDARCLEMAAEMTNLETRVAEFENSNRSLNDSIRHLKEQLKDTENQLDEMRCSNHTLAQRLDEETNSVKILQSALDKAEENLTSSGSTAEALQQYKESLSKRIEMLNEMNRSLRSEKLDHEDLIRHLKGELFVANDMYLQEQEFSTELQVKIQQLEQSHEILKEDLIRMTENYETLEQNMVELKLKESARLERLETELRAKGESLETALGQVLTLETTSMQLIKDLDELKDENALISSEKNRIDVDFDNSNKENVRLKQTIDRMKSQNSELADGLERSRQTNSELTETLENERHERTRLSENVARSRAATAELEECLKDARASYDDTAERLARIEREKSKLATENKRLNDVDVIGELRKRLETRQNELRLTTEENGKLIKELSTSETAKTNLEIEKLHLEEKVAEMRTAQVKLQVERDSNRVSLEQEILSLRDSRSQSQRQCQELCEKLEKIQDDYSRHQIEFKQNREQFDAQLQSQQDQYESLIAALEEQLNDRSHSNDSEISALQNEINKWQKLYEDLQDKVAPFQVQLDSFEEEKRLLVGRSNETKAEVQKLSEQYAKLLGHQNHKQKIQHIVKIKQENVALKDELSSLREQVIKLKRQQQTSEVKKRFDPSKAFQHVKENSTVVAPKQLQKTYLESPTPSSGGSPRRTPLRDSSTNSPRKLTNRRL